MTAYGLDVHPVGVIYDLVQRYGTDLEVSFSKYFYRPSSTFDEREIFSVPAMDVTPEWVAAQSQELKPGWELALNSLVRDGRGRTLHLGMIDFVGSPPGPLVMERMKAILGIGSTSEISFFYSGRSLHAYFCRLVSKKGWVELLGRTLLMNLAGEEPIVDSRWVGHRLVGGYSALRWTANSEFYVQVPHRINPLQKQGWTAD